MPRVTTIALPGHPNKYIRALAAAAIAVRQSDPDAADLVQALVDGIDAAQRDKRLLQRVRRLHRPARGDSTSNPGHCVECFRPWPCATVRQVDALGLEDR